MSPIQPSSKFMQELNKVSGSVTIDNREMKKINKRVDVFHGIFKKTSEEGVDMEVINAEVKEMRRRKVVRADLCQRNEG